MVKVCSALASSAVSSMPASYAPGVAFMVSILVTPDASTTAYGVEDEVPAGWAVANIDNSGAFDSVNNKVKWGPFFDSTTRTLSYSITPPAGASGPVTFSGSASFDGVDVAISGQRTMSSGGGTGPTAPSITMQPQSQAVSAGSSVTFTVAASGTAPLSYQWQKDGSALSGQTNANLLLGSVSSADAGSYTVVVSNAAGSVTSQPATLSITSSSSNSAVSSMPASYTPGVAFTVSILVTPDASTTAYGIEDQVPTGWAVTNIDNSGAFDSVNNKVKWGPFFDSTTRTLSYSITPPAAANGAVTFSGSASFDGIDVAISGQRTTSSATASPARMVGPALRDRVFSVAVPAQPGGSYTLEATDSLTTPNWTPVDTESGTGGNLTLRDTQATGASRFYRVKTN
jgi:Immunoglobulin domain